MATHRRKVIRISAEDSPNVRYALAQIQAGQEPTGEVILPGVLPYNDYVTRMANWDPVRKCIGLDGMFYTGAEVLMYPPDWLNRCELLALRMVGQVRQALAIGIDTAQGGDKTAMTASDELGMIKQESYRTPDTSVICGNVIAFGKRFGVPPERWYFDRGGGGKIHADELRKRGYNVKTVFFNDPATKDVKDRDMRGRSPNIKVKIRQEEREVRTTYINKRAEMYGILRNLIDPSLNERGFGIPAEYTELRRQLSLIPLLYDQEGRLFILPKEKPKSGVDDKRTLRAILGCSPDEADSLVLSVYGVQDRVTAKPKTRIGAIRSR